jgi:hypothetical protein
MAAVTAASKAPLAMPALANSHLPTESNTYAATTGLSTSCIAITPF